MTALRPVVEQFAREMERRLRANDRKGGWSTEEPATLIARLREELAELEQAIDNATAKGKVPLSGGPLWWRVIEEAADVANFAMMVADLAANARIGGLADLHRLRERMTL